ACPLVNEFIDYNCDQTLKISFTGDSFVNGVGDSRRRGGYVGRIRNKIDYIKFTETGVNGVTPSELRRKFLRYFSRKRATYKRTINSDIVIIDVGRNSYWDNESPGRVVRDIKRLVKTLKNLLTEEQADLEPKIFVATLMPTKRSFQASFIKSVNNILLKRRNFNTLPVFLRFDRLAVRNIGSDGLHPTSRGYRRAANKLKRFLTNKAQRNMARTRVDNDLDGIFDYFETSRYQTDPFLADTDQDTVLDGQEVFYDQTNPLDYYDHS
ncbi:MAG: SGNH/GDSL hydrolase family protein, partial [Bdellovibrionales bacterium]|nr:SGNH/GDSL hydrolase family protein [Bdellovibrionales bacterium]